MYAFTFAGFVKIDHFTNINNVPRMYHTQSTSGIHAPICVVPFHTYAPHIKINPLTVI